MYRKMQQCLEEYKKEVEKFKGLFDRIGHSYYDPVIATPQNIADEMEQTAIRLSAMAKVLGLSEDDRRIIDEKVGFKIKKR